jgi:hypothetical protein
MLSGLSCPGEAFDIEVRLERGWSLSVARPEEGRNYRTRDKSRSRAVNEKAPLSGAPKARPPVEYGGPGQTGRVFAAPVGRPSVSRVILSSYG